MSSKLIKNIYKQFNKLAKYLDDNDKQIMIISLISYSTLTNHLDNINSLGANITCGYCNEDIITFFNQIQNKPKIDKLTKIINKTIKYLNKYYCAYCNYDILDVNYSIKDNINDFVKEVFFDYMQYCIKSRDKFNVYSVTYHVDNLIGKSDNNAKVLLDMITKIYHINIEIIKETKIDCFNEYFYGLIKSEMNINQKHILLLMLLMYSEANYYSVFKDQLVINQINSVSEFIDKLLNKFIIDKYYSNNEYVSDCEYVRCINEFKEVVMEIKDNINESFNIDCLIKIMDYLHFRIKYCNFNYRCINSFIDFTKEFDNSSVFSLPNDVMAYVICEMHINWQKHVGYLRYYDYYSGNSDIILRYNELVLKESFSDDINIRVFNMLLGKFDNVFKKESRDIINDGRKQNHDVLFCNLLNINRENKEETDKIRMEYIKKLMGSLGKCGIGIIIIPGSLFIGNKELELMIRKDTLTIIRCNKNIFYPKVTDEEYYYIALIVKYIHNPNVTYYLNRIEDGYEIVNVNGKIKRIKTYKSNCARDIPLTDDIVDELFDKGFIRMFS